MLRENQAAPIVVDQPYYIPQCFSTTTGKITMTEGHGMLGKPPISPFISKTPVFKVRPRPTTGAAGTATAAASAPHLKGAGAASASSAPKSQNTLKLPSPVSYLHELFGTLEKGRQVLMRDRKYSFSKPDQARVDAYDVDLLRAVREGNLERLRAMLAGGQNFDACNRFGESLIHMSCRRGDLKVVKFLIEEANVPIDVTDDFGRTPVHDACWTREPNLQVMEVLLKASSPTVFLAEDVRGHTPFHYSRGEHWDKWLGFLKERENLLIRKLSVAAIGAA